VTTTITPLFRERKRPTEGRAVETREATTQQHVEAALCGSAHAAAQLYHAHFDDLRRSAYYMTGDRTAAEDLAQEAFALALSKLARFDPARSPFSTWLHAITRNLVRKHWRSQARRGRAYGRLEHTPTVARSGVDPEAALVRRQRFEAVRDALATLPEPLREAFVLVDLQGIAGDEAAARLGITPGNLRVRALRARTRIRRELEKQGCLGRRTER
jgi:RNA polymerase sigma-70 factor (ECF subfamily)